MAEQLRVLFGDDVYRGKSPCAIKCALAAARNNIKFRVALSSAGTMFTELMSEPSRRHSLSRARRYAAVEKETWQALQVHMSEEPEVRETPSQMLKSAVDAAT